MQRLAIEPCQLKKKKLMKHLFTLLLLSIFNLSCQKDQVKQKEGSYKARYVGESCWVVLELLEPLDGSIPTEQYENYKYAIGTGPIPQNYKDGTPFYFTVNKIDSNRAYLTYCIPTKYYIEITNLSR